MPNKFDTVEDLEKFAEKLRDTKEKLVKAIDMIAAPENELVKFNDHGQWTLTKNELPYWHPKAQMQHQKNLRVQERQPKANTPRPAPKVQTSTDVPYVNIPGKGRGEPK